MILQCIMSGNFQIPRQHSHANTFFSLKQRPDIKFNFSASDWLHSLNKCSSYAAAVDTRKRRVWCKNIKLIRFQLFISVSHECMLIQRARVICTKKGDKALPTIKIQEMPPTEWFSLSGILVSIDIKTFIYN